MRSALLCLLALGIWSAARADDSPLPGAEPERLVLWGKTAAGLQTNVTVPKLQASGQALFRLRLRNPTDAPVTLPGGTFGWLFLGQGRGAAWCSERLTWAELPDAPTEIPAGAEREVRLDLTETNVYPLPRRKLTFAGGYPVLDAKAEAVALPASLDTGRRVALSFLLVLPRPEDPERPWSVASNTIKIEVAPAGWAAIPAARREQIVADLRQRFQRGAGAAKGAFNSALPYGPELSPQLADLALDRDAPYFTRMWVATTLACLGGPEAEEALVQLADDPGKGVADVVAFHAPQLRSDRVDAAILANATTPEHQSQTVWALRGFIAQGRDVPPALADYAFATTDEQVRVTAIEALAKQADGPALERLRMIVAGDSEQERAVVGRAARRNALRDPALLLAMAKALEKEGEIARQYLAEALSALTGRDRLYDPEAPEADRAAILADWARWAADHQAD